MVAASLFLIVSGVPASAEGNISPFREVKVADCDEALKQARDLGWVTSRGYDHAPVDRVWTPEAVSAYLDYLLSSQYKDYLQKSSRTDQAWHTVVFKKARVPRTRAVADRIRRLKEQQGTDVIFLNCGDPLPS